MGTLASNWILWQEDNPPCLRAITNTTLLVKATEKSVVGAPLTIFVPHAVEALLTSQSTQHFSVGYLISYELLLLTPPLLCSNNLNPATLFSSVFDEVFHNCLMLMNHLLTPCDDLQEIHFGNADFSWFTDGSYFKGKNGKYYCAGYATATAFDSVEGVSFPLATLVQKAELYTLT